MSSSSTEKYDVFLSFRGADTRRDFTSHLFQALEKKSIKTYMDCLLERGDEVGPALARAIDNSQVSIVIFSDNYATSSWCLDELVRILQRREDQGQVVIPVFYDTDPSDIRQQKGTYGKAFVKYEADLANNDNEFNRQRIISWKAALTEGANISGWDSRAYRDDVKLIKNVVKDVSQKQKLRHPIERKDLVGTEEICRKVELYMNNNVRVLGIWGMTGIGKTTIAKVLFAKLFPHFDNVCFANVKEYSLDRFLSELLKEDVTGITFNMDCLRSKKVFIVLDDVNSLNELLEYLCKEYPHQNQESRLIITTTNKQLLEGRVDFIHKVNKWNDPESLRLFSSEAFSTTTPPEHYKNLSTRAVKSAGGVPLALKVLGSYFRRKRPPFWEATLRKLDKYPNKDIHDLLKVRYEGLDDLERKIFLDIAFFFSGEKKDRVVSILDACGFEASNGIEVLEDQALITIAHDNVIEMHDLLQKTAFQIEREESSRNPGGRSRRVRDIEEVRVALEDNKGTDAVEGIILDLSQINDWHLSANTFQKMNNLRFLKFYISLGQSSGCVYLPTVQELFSNKLRYLEWNGYPMESLPPTFCSKLLVEIRMPHSHVKKLWQGIQELDYLEEIDLSESKQLEELPDLSKASRLKWVNLCGCKNLHVLHSSVLSSDTLVTLILDGCTNLSSVKGGKHLESLQNISVNGCSSLKEFAVSSDSIEDLDLSKTGIETLDKSIGLLHNLRRLNLEGLALKHLPEELSCLTSLMELKLSSRELEIGKDQLRNLFGGLRSLQKLHLKKCRNLFELPDNIGDLSKLKELILDGSSVKSLPTSIKSLQGLEVLSLQSCTQLGSLPELPPFIKEFVAQNCTSLESVSNFTTFATKMVGKEKHISFENSLELKRHSLDSIMESLRIAMASAAFHNVLVSNYSERSHGCNYNSVGVCVPGSRVPRQFKHQTNKSSSIKVQFPDSSNLLGIIYYVVLSPSRGRKNRGGKIQCRCHLKDGTKTTWLGKAISELNTKHVYIWYESFQCNTIRKLNQPEACFEFSVITDTREVDASISIIECGVHLISVSELDSVLAELDSDRKEELEKEFESDFQRSITMMSQQLHPHSSEDHSQARIPPPPPPTETKKRSSDEKESNFIMKKRSSDEKESNVMRNQVPNQQRDLNDQASHSCKLEESKPVAVENDVRSSDHFSDVVKSMESACNGTMKSMESACNETTIGDAGRRLRENNKGSTKDVKGKGNEGKPTESDAGLLLPTDSVDVENVPENMSIENYDRPDDKEESKQPEEIQNPPRQQPIVHPDVHDQTTEEPHQEKENEQMSLDQSKVQDESDEDPLAELESILLGSPKSSPKAACSTGDVAVREALHNLECLLDKSLEDILGDVELRRELQISLECIEHASDEEVSPSVAELVKSMTSSVEDLFKGFALTQKVVEGHTLRLQQKDKLVQQMGDAKKQQELLQDKMNQYRLQAESLEREGKDLDEKIRVLVEQKRMVQMKQTELKVAMEECDGEKKKLRDEAKNWVAEGKDLMLAIKNSEVSYDAAISKQEELNKKWEGFRTSYAHNFKS